MSELISKQCVDFVKSFEGFSATRYLDSVGVPTIGYGMTGQEIAGLTHVTEAQAAQMLENLLNSKYATPIKANLDSRGVKLTQNQFDALVSMAYNIGVSGLLGSTLYRNICNGIRDVSTITANFTAWSKAGGQTLAGLLRRRQAEAAMFFSNGNTVVKEEEKKVDAIIVYRDSRDLNAVLKLSAHVKCPVIGNNVPFDFSNVKRVIGIGTDADRKNYTRYVTQMIPASQIENYISKTK